MIARAPQVQPILSDEVAQLWIQELRGEAEDRARHVQLCGESTAALMARQSAAFASLQQRQQQIVDAGHQREQRLELLRRRTATVLACTEGDLCLERVIAAAPASRRAELESLHKQRRDSSGELRRLLDRNALLVRTTLGLVRDQLDVLVGPRVGDGYGRRGRPVDTVTPAGSVFSARS